MEKRIGVYIKRRREYIYMINRHYDIKFHMTHSITKFTIGLKTVFFKESD